MRAKRILNLTCTTTRKKWGELSIKKTSAEEIQASIVNLMSRIIKSMTATASI